MVVRFNISGLRNNYNLNDLTKMSLKLFGIKVGELKDSNLSFNHQMDNMTQDVPSNNIGADFDNEQENTRTNLHLPIIDILMAGV